MVRWIVYEDDTPQCSRCGIGNYYMDVMLWGAATDGKAEKEWKDQYGLTKTLIKARDQKSYYEAQMWELWQSQYEITGCVI